MATLTVQDLVKSASLAASYAAVNSSDEMPNDGKTLLHVKNGGGGSINVTITAQVTSIDGGPNLGTFTLSNLVVAVANGAEKFIGPFPKKAFNNTNARVAIAYSGTSSVTAAALRMPA